MKTSGGERPLSPHLQIYKPQITSVLSILHRFTGIFLSFSAIGFVVWVWALAVNPFCYAWMRGQLSVWYGKLLILSLLFSFFYHLANGIRHLIWNTGYGFELRQVTFGGWIVVGFSGGATVFYAVRYIWG